MINFEITTKAQCSFTVHYLRFSGIWFYCLQCKIVNLLFVDFPRCHCYVMLLLVANVCFLSLYIYTVDVDTVTHIHILTASFQVNVGDPFAH